MNFRISALISAKKSDRDCFESVDQFGEYCHLNVKSSQSMELGYAFFGCVGKVLHGGSW